MVDEVETTVGGFDPNKPVVAFDYIKASNFQVLRADGVIGGITPSSGLHMAFYSERQAIPRRITHEVSEAGQLGEVLETQGRNSIVREMSVDLFLDVGTATAIRDWLSIRLEELSGGEKK